jgi:soluble lytic murein transglycosylase-like protein
VTYDPDDQRWSVDQFLAGLRHVESSGNYRAVNPNSGAYGAYQTIPKYTCWYYQSAGLDPVNINDPATQDAMAEHHCRRHYEKYGNWYLVALAWHKGGTNADAVVEATGGCGPAVTIEDIEEMFPGESEYLLKVKEGAEAAGG